MKILTICSILVALSAFWNMTTIVRSAEPVSEEEPVSHSESPEFTMHEEYLILLINVNEEVLESTDADDHKLIDSRTKDLAKSKEKLEHYRQNIAPLSASITNRYERDLVDSIAMYEWDLENLSYDQVTNEKIRNLITNAIKSTKKTLENHRQHLEEKRQEDKLWENLRKARKEGPRSKIDEAEAALTQFLAERLSKKTEKTYPPDISLSEILSERVRYNQFQGKRQRLFIFITAAAVLLVVSLGCFAFFRRRRRNSALPCVFVAFMFGNIIPSARSADPTTIEMGVPTGVPRISVRTNEQGDVLHIITTVGGRVNITTNASDRFLNWLNAENKRLEISGYEEVLLSRLAVYEKLLSKTDPEDQELVEWRTEMLADAKAVLEHYRQNVATLSVSITNRHERFLVDFKAMSEWQLKNLPPGSKSEELLNSSINTTEEKLEQHRQYLEEKRQEDKLWENLRKARKEGPRSKIDEAEAALTQFLAERLSKKTEKTYPPDISLSEILSERVRYNQSQGKRQRLFIFITAAAVLLVVSLGCFAFFRRRRRNSALPCVFVAFMFGNIIPSARSADPTTAETETLVAVHTNKQGQVLYTVTGTAGVYVYKGIRRTNRYEKLLLSVLAFHEKNLEETDPEDQQRIGWYVEDIEDQKAKIEYYRQNIVPLNASVTNSWERYLLDKIAVSQWEMSRDSLNFEEKEFLLREIKNTQKELEEHRQEEVELRREHELRMQLIEAERKGNREKIAEVEASLAKFLAEKLSQETGESYPADISLKEIQSEWREYYDSLDRAERLPYAIGLTVVLWGLLYYFAFTNLRRKSEDEDKSSS